MYLLEGLKGDINNKIPNKVFWIIICGLFLFPVNIRAADSDIIISEIAAYESSGCEWIEIYNSGAGVVDVSDWKFWENGTNHGLKVSSSSLQIDTVIESGEYVIIAQDDTKLFSSSCGDRYSPPNGTVFDSSWSTLNESGESIGLKNSSSVLVENFTYVSAKNFSLERIDLHLLDYTATNWHEHTSGNSFGRLNSSVVAQAPAAPEPVSATTPTAEVVPVVTPEVSSSLPEIVTPSASRIVINEFLSYSSGINREWIELYNSSDNSASLDGWELRDGGSVIARLSGIIQPRGFAVIDLNGSKLNNEGDLIALIDSVGSLRDQVVFGNWQDGAQNTNHAPAGGLDLSVARVFDGYDTNNDGADFMETLLSTKGSANSIVSKKVTSPSVDTTVNPTTSVFSLIPLLEFKNNNALTTTSLPIVTTIEDAQVPSLEVSVDTSAVGSIITISGIVVVPPGIFGSQYFYLGSFDDDRSTVNRGWQIYQNKKLFPALSIGDMLSVTGEVTEIKSGRRLKFSDASAVKLLDQSFDIEPLPMTAIQIGVARDGAVVVVEGEVTEVKSGHIFVDDGGGEIGVMLKSGTGLSSKQFLVGDMIMIVGMALRNSKGAVEVLPRVSGDISIVKHAVNKEGSRAVSLQVNNDTLVSTGTNQIIVATHNNKDENVVEKYLSAGATGLTSLLIGFLLKARGGILLTFLRRKE